MVEELFVAVEVPTPEEVVSKSNSQRRHCRHVGPLERHAVGSSSVAKFPHKWALN